MDEGEKGGFGIFKRAISHKIVQITVRAEIYSYMVQFCFVDMSVSGIPIEKVQRKYVKKWVCSLKCERMGNLDFGILQEGKPKVKFFS